MLIDTTVVFKIPFPGLEIMMETWIRMGRIRNRASVRFVINLEKNLDPVTVVALMLIWDGIRIDISWDLELIG